MSKRKKKQTEDKDGPPIMALYLRVSTEEQAQEGFSLQAQEERGRSYCKAKDYQIYKVYIEEGQSGRTINRPKYQAMLKDINKWDGILVLKMDRIHRNSRNFMAMMDELNKRDKLFVSMQETLDTSTAMGRFVMDIIQRIAQLESEQTGERVHMGMKQKATTDAPGILGFNAPYGYEFDEGELCIITEEAQVIIQMFRQYIKGKTLEKIAGHLNKKHRTRVGKAWTRINVGYILNNPVYAGWLIWDGHLKKAEHEGIVSVEMYNTAQNRRRYPKYIGG